MRPFRRQAREDRNSEFVELLGEARHALYVNFEIALERCVRLMRLHEAQGELSADQRSEARQGVVDLSAAALEMFWYLGRHRATGESDQLLLPPQALVAVGRLTYGLIALAETAPEPEAFLTLDELDGLIAQYDLEPWLALWRKADAEHGTNIYGRLHPAEAAGR